MTPTKKVEASKEARHLAAVLLDVLAGLRTPPQAATALAVSLPRYYQLEERGLNGLLLACATRPKGRQANAETQLHMLTKENQRLQRELARSQSLVRLTQRAVGVSPPAPVKATGKRKPRRATVRALKRAERLRAEATAEAGTECAGASTE